MGTDETIRLEADIKKEAYLSALAINDMVKENNSLTNAEFIEFLESTGIFELPMYLVRNRDSLFRAYTLVETPIDVKKFFLDFFEARKSMMSSVTVTEETETFPPVIDFYETAEELRKIHWRRFDLLKLEPLLNHSPIVEWGKRDALLHLYRNFTDEQTKLYDELPTKAKELIQEQFQAVDSPSLNDIVETQRLEIEALKAQVDALMNKRPEKTNNRLNLKFREHESEMLKWLAKREGITEEEYIKETVIQYMEKNRSISEAFALDDGSDEAIARRELLEYLQKNTDIMEVFNLLSLAKFYPSESSKFVDDDEPTHHKSLGSMTVLIATLLKLAEYDKDDLKQPHGALNKEIQAKAEGLGLSIKKDFIEKWLKKADDIL